MKENQAELLPPEEETVPELPMLRIQTSLETLKDYFDGQAEGIRRTVEFCRNAVIDSPKSRDQARDVRKSLAAFKTAIDGKRLLSKKPVEDFLTEYKQLCDAVIAIAEEGIHILDEKGVAYNTEVKRLENLEKARILAEEKAEREKIEADRKKREAEEQARQAEEIRKVREKEEADRKAAAKVKDEQARELLKIQQEEKRKADLAKIEADRVAREKEEADRKAREQAELDANQQKMAVGMAVATGKGKTKGVKNVWVIEVVDEKQVPREFCSYDPKKAKKYVEAEISQETDAFKIIPGLRCYVAVKASGR